MTKNLTACCSRIDEIKREIAVIANVPKASRETALKAATLLVSAYPGQQANDPLVAEAYMQQVASLCTGVDLDVLSAMVDVTIGTSLVRQESTFLPTAAKVADWIDWKMEPKRARIGWYLDEIKSIEDREAEVGISPEERARRADMLTKVAETIRQTAKATQRANPPLNQACQIDGEEAANAREEALKNLDDIGVGNY